MGRPINNRYIGNVSGTGQQIEATAYFVGKGGTSAAWICAQKATNTYNMVSVCGQYACRVELTNGGVALQPGQANITVQPYGYGGSGATAVANLGVTSYAVVSGGNGPTTAGYAPGQILSVDGGSYNTNQQANAIVTTVTLGNISVTSSNVVGYTVGDTFTWAYNGWYTPTVVTVASTTGNGIVSGLTYTSPGSTGNTQVTYSTPPSSVRTANSWATGTTFDVRWDITGLAAYNKGDYTTPPTNPVSFTPKTGCGVNATATATYGISSAHLTAGGLGYQAVQVAVSGNGSAIVCGTVNATGNVSALTITSPGTFGPSRPTLTVTPLASLEYAQVIKNLTVTTFLYNTYEWGPTGTVPQPGQAVLQTA